DVSLVDIVLEGWGKYKELLQYRDRTRYPPDQTILLPLAHHEIRSVHKPYVDVLLDDKPIGRVTFTVDLRLTFDGVVLVIQDGSIREVKAGTCEGRGALSCGPIKLVDRRIVKFDLPGRVALPNGFPIPGLTPREPPPETAPPAEPTGEVSGGIGAMLGGAAFSHAPVYRLGRSRDNDFVIGDRTVSRYHALISVAGDGDVHLTDLDSTGGTFVREAGGWARITNRDVAPDSTLRFGDYEIGLGAVLAGLAEIGRRRAG
ncbi:MAG: FHA domain-containing protein, partial [Candidatus Eiseniibacteriota bacterium]